jgi:hypothetical protein
MNGFLTFLKSHWPAILAFGIAAWAQFGTQVTAFVSTHPHLSGWFAFASFAVAYYVKSPLTPKAP